MSASGRIRTIKAALMSDALTASLSHEGFRLYVGMVLCADDHGFFNALPGALNGFVFHTVPATASMPELYRELRRLVRFYAVRGQLYGELRGWKKHQKVDHPGKPKWPLPTDDDAVALAWVDVDDEADFNANEPTAASVRATARAIAPVQGLGIAPLGDPRESSRALARSSGSLAPEGKGSGSGSLISPGRVDPVPGSIAREESPETAPSGFEDDRPDARPAIAPPPLAPANRAARTERRQGGPGAPMRPRSGGSEPPAPPEAAQAPALSDGAARILEAALTHPKLCSAADAEWAQAVELMAFDWNRTIEETVQAVRDAGHSIASDRSGRDWNTLAIREKVRSFVCRKPLRAEPRSSGFAPRGGPGPIPGRQYRTLAELEREQAALPQPEPKWGAKP